MVLLIIAGVAAERRG